MNYNIDTVDGLAKYAKNIASAVLDGKLYDSNAVLAICSMLHCNEDYAAECLDAWIETEQIHRSHKQEGSLFKKILNEAKSLNFSMESLALALEDIMPFAHPKCKLIKVFGKKQILTNYMPCFDYFGNDPYNPKSDTDNSFMVSLYHGAHQRLYIFNDDEMTEWNIEIDHKSVATVSYNDVNTLAHTIKELLYKNWPEKMKEAEDFVERKWEEGKRHAQEYIEMINRSLADCNNDWSEYGRKNAGKDADWFVNKVRKNYINAEKIISLCDKFMPTIRFTESKRMKEAIGDVNSIIKAIENYGFDDFISAYQVGKNIWVDLDTEDEDAANNVAAEIESKILHNNRKHGRDDLQGMGQWHVNVGTIADFCEDDYNDLDPDVRDMCQIIIEPAESYKARRQYDW